MKPISFTCFVNNDGGIDLVKGSTIIWPARMYSKGPFVLVESIFRRNACNYSYKVIR